MVEVGVAIFAACLSTYRPLLKHMHIHGFGDSSGKSSKRTGSKLSRSGMNTGDKSVDHHELGAIRFNGKLGKHDVTVGGGNDSDSQELILHGNGIQKDTRVDVEYADAHHANHKYGSNRSLEGY
jgi:hypothetical protein